MDCALDWYLQTETDLRSLVAQFEAGTLPTADRRHSVNLAICVWYMLNDNLPLTRLRYAIAHYCEAQGGVNGPDSGYHETLTRFWLEVVERYMKTLPVMSTVEYARRVVSAYGSHKDLYRAHYEIDVPRSREARTGWIPPASWPPTP